MHCIHPCRLFLFSFLFSFFLSCFLSFFLSSFLFCSFFLSSFLPFTFNFFFFPYFSFFLFSFFLFQRGFFRDALMFILQFYYLVELSTEFFNSRAATNFNRNIFAKIFGYFSLKKQDQYIPVSRTGL